MSSAAQVIVAGGGAAGLAAATELSRRGVKVLLLEGRERLGGRIHTLHDRNAPVPVELGAEFIHGEPEETFAIVRAASLPVDELLDARYWARDGRFSTLPDFWERMIQIRKRLHRYLKKSRKDIALSEFLAAGGLGSEDRDLFQSFVEGYHAAYPERLSARWVAGDPDNEEDADHKQFRLKAGYGALVDTLRARLDPRTTEIRLNTVITRIQWSPGSVTVSCRSGLGTTLGPFSARALVVALPTAVLQAGALRFDPQLVEKDKALRHLEAGQVFKMILRFRRDFWNEEAFLKERLSHNGTRALAPFTFAQALGTAVPTWWTTRPARSSNIIAWAGGPRGEALLNQDFASQVNTVLDTMSTAFGVGRGQVDDLFESAAFHDWRADPFSRAAYTYVGVRGASAQEILARPVKGTLFFAGEATDREQTGTVAGALASGRRAANQLRRTLKA